MSSPPTEVRRSARTTRLVMFVLTVLTATAALFLEPAIAGAVRRGALPPSWLFFPIAVYGVFLVVLLVDRFRLVRAGLYPAGRAFFQAAVAIAVAFLLLPSTIEDYQQKPQHGGSDRLLGHADPDVRAAAVYALGFDEPTPSAISRVLARLEDGHPSVRRAAQRVLSRWSGRSVEDLAGIQAWAVAKSTRSSTATGGTGP